MKYLGVIGFLHLVNCVAQATNPGVAVADIVSDCSNSDRQEPGRYSPPNFDFKIRPPAQVPDFISDEDLLNSKLKICMRDPLMLKALFMNNRLECGLDLPSEGNDQDELVRYSKNYIIDFFRLPSIEDIYEINQLSDDEFKEYLTELLSRIWVNPRYASQGGKEYIRDVVADGYYGIKAAKVMVEYYWSSSYFRDIFLDRALGVLANSMPMRDYFELENLLGWFQSEYSVWTEEQWTDLKSIVKKNYGYPNYTWVYWKCWFKVRSLEDRPTH